MKFTEYKGEIPRADRKNLKCFFEEFMSSNVEIAILEFNEKEYKSLDIARESLAQSVKRYGFPITVMKRKDQVFLIRRDM